MKKMEVTFEGGVGGSVIGFVGVGDGEGLCSGKQDGTTRLVTGL
jgi:hypothetical protein